MSAFQSNAFQGNAFQIGAPPPQPITIDEIIPQMAGTITTIIAVSGWVFAGAPAVQQFTYDTPMPPQRAVRQTIRPVEDAYYRYANSQQSVMALEPQSRPPRPMVTVRRPEPDTFIAPAVTPVIYPIALEEPKRPQPLPPTITRMERTGTVGVFFYMETYDYGWADPGSRKVPAPVRAPRFDADPFIPVTVTPTYDFGWANETRRPVQLKPANTRNLTPDTYIVIPGTTYDYGWFAPPQLPVRQKPSNAQVLAPDLFINIPGATYDYGWFDPPQLPRQLPPSKAIFITPEWWPWEPAPPIDEHPPHFGGWPPDKKGRYRKKKRKEEPVFEQRLPTFRDTLLRLQADLLERQDEEELLMILKKLLEDQ